MVRLQRGAPPALLVEHGAAWTQRWKEIRASQGVRDWAPKNAKKLISEELQKLTHGKCAFCETVLGVGSHLEIEHHFAKSSYPERAFEWSNLFPVCRKCNSSKGSADHSGVLIKPDVEDPQSMIWFHWGTGELEPRAKLQKENRQRVERTLELWDLQRGPLCAKRIEKMEFAIRWMERMAHLGSGLSPLLREEWLQLSDPRSEYKLVVRQVLESREERRLAEWDRRRFRIGE